MNSGIYKITSPSGRIYIGQAINLTNREKDYKTYNCKAQRLLYNSLKKYGWEEHKFEIVIKGDFNLEELNTLEIKYIIEFNSFRGWSTKGMNLTTGGDNCIRYEGSKKKISKSLYKYHKEIGHSEETKRKIAETLKGKVHTQETKDKRNISRKLYWDNKGRIGKHKRDKKVAKASLIKEQREIRDQEIIKLLKEGLQQDIIAKRYNISPSVITQLKKKYNLIIDNRIIGKGSNNNFAKLTEQQVKEIKTLLLTKEKHQSIADKYNVSKRAIKAIKSGQNWSHISID